MRWLLPVLLALVAPLAWGMDPCALALGQLPLPARWEEDSYTRRADLSKRSPKSRYQELVIPAGSVKLSAEARKRDRELGAVILALDGLLTPSMKVRLSKPFHDHFKRLTLEAGTRLLAATGEGFTIRSEDLLFVEVSPDRPLKNSDYEIEIHPGPANGPRFGASASRMKNEYGGKFLFEPYAAEEIQSSAFYSFPISRLIPFTEQERRVRKNAGIAPELPSISLGSGCLGNAGVNQGACSTIEHEFVHAETVKSILAGEVRPFQFWMKSEGSQSLPSDAQLDREIAETFGALKSEKREGLSLLILNRALDLIERVENQEDRIYLQGLLDLYSKHSHNDTREDEAYSRFLSADEVLAFLKSAEIELKDALELARRGGALTRSEETELRTRLLRLHHTGLRGAQIASKVIEAIERRIESIETSPEAVLWSILTGDERAMFIQGPMHLPVSRERVGAENILDQLEWIRALTEGRFYPFFLSLAPFGHAALGETLDLDVIKRALSRALEEVPELEALGEN